eukprot:6117773-Karenia_brevis.AAC.1
MVPAGAHGGYSHTKVMQVALVADSSGADTYTGASPIPWAAIASTLNVQSNSELLEYSREGETIPAGMMIIEPAAAVSLGAALEGESVFDGLHELQSQLADKLL